MKILTKTDIYIKPLKIVFLPTILIFLSVSFVKMSFVDTFNLFFDTTPEGSGIGLRIFILLVEIVFYIVLFNRYKTQYENQKNG